MQMKRRDFLVASAGLAGSVLPGIGLAQSKPCPQPTLGVDTGQTATTSCAPSTAQADWQSRTSGSGVVWYHDFQTADEVNNFRWSPGYNSGNDPLAKGGPNAGLCHQLVGDGVTGGSASASTCLELVRAAGSDDGSVWWRPFSPLQGGTTSGNGRGAGQNDPGAGATITPAAWNVSDGSGTTAGWSKGWYGAAANTGTVPNSTWDGNDYYIQCYVKVDPQRIATSQNIAVDAGKMFYFTVCSGSNVLQEIIVESYGKGSYTGYDYFQMYTNQGTYNPLYSYGFSESNAQPGSQYGTGVCNMGSSSGDAVNCFVWPLGKWVNVQWHITPPVSGGNLGVQAWVCPPGTTSYIKVWDQSTIGPYTFGGSHPGWQALICSIYQNGSNMTQFYQRYCQLILSKTFIPCPAVPVTW
jgi:hypothetical protein